MKSSGMGRSRWEEGNFSHILETILVDVPTPNSLRPFNNLSHVRRRGRHGLVGGNGDITPEVRRIVQLGRHLAFWFWYFGKEVEMVVCREFEAWCYGGDGGRGEGRVECG